MEGQIMWEDVGGTKEWSPAGSANHESIAGSAVIRAKQKELAAKASLGSTKNPATEVRRAYPVNVPNIGRELRNADAKQVFKPEFESIQQKKQLERRDRAIRLSKSNPFIPIGMLCTVIAMGGIAFGFTRRDPLMANYAMRARIAFQGLTIISAVAGFGLAYVAAGEDDDDDD